MARSSLRAPTRAVLALVSKVNIIASFIQSMFVIFPGENVKHYASKDGAMTYCGLVAASASDYDTVEGKKIRCRKCFTVLAENATQGAMKTHSNSICTENFIPDGSI